MPSLFTSPKRAARVAQLTETLRQLRAAQQPAQIGRIYADIVGYDSHEDDPGASLEDLRGMATDYLREVCFSEGIHCADIGLAS